jgi:class 3 adenylate cyclase
MKKLKELQSSIDEILSTDWARRKGTVVPDTDTIKHSNDAVEIDGTVLYADLADSTGLVQGYKDWFAAEVYKAYLLTACELIRNNGGTITAFDGDRVMAVYLGNSKNSDAAKTALQIDHMVTQEINPRIRNHYKTTSYQLKQAVGIDTSKLLVAKTGVWGSNDLVWVGRAANYAAKLCGLREGLYSSFITSEVFDQLNAASRNAGSPPKCMWEKVMWNEVGIEIYRSNYRWEPPT